MKTGAFLRRVPLKSILARPGRSAFLLFLALLQAACALVALLLVQGVGHELLRAEQRLGADVLVYPSAGFLQLDGACVNMLASPVQYYRDRSGLALLTENDEIDAISHQIHVSVPNRGDEGPKWIIGYEPETDFVITPWLEEGADAAGGVILGSAVGASASNGLELFGERLPIAARLARTGGEYDDSVFVPLRMLDRLLAQAPQYGVEGVEGLDPLEDYSVATIRVGDKSKVESVANWINLYIRKVTAVHSETLLVDTAGALGAHSAGIAVLGGAAWLVLLAALGVAQSVMMNERRGELHIWRVVGAPKATVRRIVLAELLILQAAGSGAGILLSWLLLARISGPVRAEVLSPSAMPLPLLAAFAASLLVGWASARFALRRAMSAADAQMLLTI